MRIALVSSYVPFVNGGARNIVEWLQAMLEEGGHQVERVYLPEVDTPDLLFQQMMAYRWVDLDAADRIICFRPQAHLVSHRHKILWFIHHIRAFYDLWDTPYRGFPDNALHRSVRDALHEVDSRAIQEAKAVFTNSRVVSERLRSYNNVQSEVLYPPVIQPERYRSAGFNNEIVCVCRLEHHKRQHLLVEAMQYVRSPVLLRLSGTSSGADYPKSLTKRIAELGLGSRVVLDNRWITEEEKIAQLSNCLAAAYLPLDEDSYGYPSLEASHASKPILTTTDSGGVLELVQDGVNGYVAEPNPEALAVAIDRFHQDRAKTMAMGLKAQARLDELNISWQYVLRRLLE